jgi:hypothetical protein
MALLRSKLGDIQYIASTAGSIYANPASKKTYIKGFLLHNTNTTAETVKLYVVPDSASALGTATGAHLILNISLTANDTLLVEMPYTLTLTDQNDSVQAVTTTASKVTVLVFGDTE